MPDHLITLSREGAMYHVPGRSSDSGAMNLPVRPCGATSRQLPVSRCPTRSPIPLRVSSGVSPDSAPQSQYIVDYQNTSTIYGIFSRLKILFILFKCLKLRATGLPQNQRGYHCASNQQSYEQTQRQHKGLHTQASKGFNSGLETQRRHGHGHGYLPCEHQPALNLTG